MTENNSYTFNWRKHSNDMTSFLGWLVPHLLAQMDNGRPLSDKTVDRFSELTDNFTNVTLTMQINGVEVSTKHMIDSIEMNMEHLAIQEANRIIDDIPRLSELQDLMSDIDTRFKEEMRSALASHGISIVDDGRYLN